MFTISKNSFQKLSNNFIKFKFSTDSAKNNVSKITIQTKPYKLFKLDKPPSGTGVLTKEEAALYYRQMQIIRKMEASASNLYMAKLIFGFCHLYSGQEAVAVGMKAAFRPQDEAITAYRSHGWMYLFGGSPHSILAELTGRETGCQRGKGGSMHTYAKKFYGGNGIVGAQVPVGTGIAFALKYKKKDGVCFTIYGDGAANQGQVFEAFNLAKLWKLPVIFVCENNGYGMGTAVERHSANTQFYTRGDYIPGLLVDGMDLVSVREATKYAIDYCLKNGPIIMETVTYRYFGHSMSDPGVSYRSREEVQEVKKNRDPITNFVQVVTSSGLLNQGDLKKIDDETKKEIDEATEKSKTDKVPDMKELTADVYSNNLEPVIRNCNPFEPLKHGRVGEAINLK